MATHTPTEEELNEMFEGFDEDLALLDEEVKAIFTDEEHKRNAEIVELMLGVSHKPTKASV